MHHSNYCPILKNIHFISVSILYSSHFELDNFFFFIVPYNTQHKFFTFSFFFLLSTPPKKNKKLNNSTIVLLVPALFSSPFIFYLYMGYKLMNVDLSFCFVNVDFHKVYGIPSTCNFLQLISK